MEINLITLIVGNDAWDLIPAIPCKVIPYEQSPQNIEEIAYSPTDGLLRFHDAAGGCEYSFAYSPAVIANVTEYSRKRKATGKGKGFAR